MAPVEESQIDTFSERPEVRSRAKDLYKRTRLITGPGTGYDLREGAPGLPAICALIACEEYVITYTPRIFHLDMGLLKMY